LGGGAAGWQGGGGAVSIVSGRRAVGGARGGGVRGVDGRWSSTTRQRRNRGRVNTSMGRTVKKKDTEKGVARATGNARPNLKI
jgi:hypothetical protein